MVRRTLDPLLRFVDTGAEVDIVSIDGGMVPIDPHSLKSEGQNPASVDRFLNDEASMRKIKASKKIGDVPAAGYDAVFLPGGHGTMWDMPKSEALATLLSKAWADGKVLAAVCHGPAGLMNVKDENGSAHPPLP